MDKVDPNKKVAHIIGDHPQTFQVFRKYGCPDMRKGFFSHMARIMSIRNAARIHRIPLDDLIEDLQKSVAENKEAAETAAPVR